MLDSTSKSIFLDSNDEEVGKWGDTTGQELKFTFDNPKTISAVNTDGINITLLLEHGLKIRILDILDNQISICIGNITYRIKSCIISIEERNYRNGDGEVVYSTPRSYEQNFLRGWFN